MKHSANLPSRLGIVIMIPVITTLLSQCATREVGHELEQNVARKGASFSRELAAQSPFKKVEISFNEASELMKERNTEYRQALIDESEASTKKGLVNNLTHEVKKSLTASVQNTLNPSEIAKAMKNPIKELPRKIESITDLKNLSHSMTQSEWARVSQGVGAEMVQREQMVSLHELFCQSENLKSLQNDMSALVDAEKLEKSKSMDKELAKLEVMIEKEHDTWLDKVRDFFNAEYHDVEFNNYNRKLSSYRGVSDPGFSDYERWGKLEHSDEMVNELKVSHEEAKPILPGVSMLKETFGVNDVRSELAHEGMLDDEAVNDVRKILKNWRELKSVQQEITELETKISQFKKGKDAAVSYTDLKEVSKLYELKQKEVKFLSQLWIMDEQCWRKGLS